MTIGGRGVATRFAIPSGVAGAVLAELDGRCLGMARARVAALLGNPDPYSIRVALAERPDATVIGCDGDALTAEVATATLVAAGHHPALAGLLAFKPPGAPTRAVPVDDPQRHYLRWRKEEAPPVTLGKVERFPTADLGDDPGATIRVFTPIPGGMAIGSDKGLTLHIRGRFEPFPWPLGVRKEARRVEAMAVSGTTLHVATSQALVTWGFRGEPTSRKHGPDQEEGHDDLNAMIAAGDRVVLGYRTRLVGGRGPADVLAFAADPTGVVYAGTRAGELHVVDGGGPIRAFVDGKPRPIRHLAWADGALWVAAIGALHRFDGASWTSEPGEPGALATDDHGRLWFIRDGAVFVRESTGDRRVEVGMERPWSLGFTPGSAWVGGVGVLVRIGAR